MYTWRRLSVAVETDKSVVVGDSMVHILHVRRPVRVRVRQIHPGAVVVVRRPRAPVRRLVVRFVPGQRAGLGAGARPRRGRLTVRVRSAAVSPPACYEFQVMNINII